MITVRGMRGLGDNIYQRAFIQRIQDQVFLDTPWPELYRDLGHVQFLQPVTSLRTQAKNASRHSDWVNDPGRGTNIRVKYGPGVLAGMQQCFGISPGLLTLPDFGPSPVTGDYAVVRPVTVRREWVAESRNPLPEYVAEAAQELRHRGIKVVSVADLEAGQEWALDPLPPADVTYHGGELPVEQVLALIQGARAVIGAIGWIVPATIAAQVPAWVICGGQGGFNAPELIRTPDASHLTFAVPDNPCNCRLPMHDCDKRITSHLEKFKEWADGLRL